MANVHWVTTATAASPTGIFDAIELTEPGTGMILVRRVFMWQTTDLGDAAEEVLRVEWIRGHTTSGSGGQTAVITPLHTLDGAATFLAELLNTTIATAGTPLSLAPQGWNIRIPLDILYPPGEYISARDGQRLVFRVSAPADAITVNCSCLVEQL
jgi:hypothetical protein